MDSYSHLKEMRTIKPCLQQSLTVWIMLRNVHISNNYFYLHIWINS